MEKRKRDAPDRPLIRISSTFFWHLSSDYTLAPLPSLHSRTRALRASHIDLGLDEGEDVVYEPMKVGQQVQKLVHCENPRFILLTQTLILQ